MEIGYNSPDEERAKFNWKETQASHEVVHSVEVNNKQPSKWLMEITDTRMGVEHPIDYDFEKLPTQIISINELVGFEPDEKMQKQESEEKLNALIEEIKNGTYEAPPILVREYGSAYQVIDGHHRFHAHKLAGVETIEVKIVPAEDIEYRDSRKK